MWRRLAIAIGITGLLAGCQSNTAKPLADRVDMDSPSLTDAPEPKIRPETYIAAGDLAAARGQMPQAAEQYAKALEASPKDVMIARRLALAYVKSNQIDRAIETWKKCVTLSDGSSDSYGSLGYAYELANKPAEAEKTYKEGIAKNPTGSLVQTNYGLMLVRKNEVDQAVPHLSAVLKPHEVNYNIASVYEQMGRRDLAQFYYRRAIECSPDFAPAKQKLALME